MKSNRTNKAWQPPVTPKTKKTAEQRQGQQLCADAKSWVPVAAPSVRAKRPNASALLEQRRAQILAELDRIRAEVIAYGSDVAVPTYGHAGDLGGVLEGLDYLHLVGRAYKLEAGK